MNQTTKLLMTALTSLSVGASVASAQVNHEMPRGRDIHPLAGNCTIGPFRQTSKAGGYNTLCEIMSDSEKCLALIKGHFNRDGSHEATLQSEKLRFCLETLESELIKE